MDGGQKFLGMSVVEIGSGKRRIVLNSSVLTSG
jgi:hypothetical protein